jgi:hypothetical protein
MYRHKKKNGAASLNVRTTDCFLLLHLGTLALFLLSSRFFAASIRVLIFHLIGVLMQKLFLESYQLKIGLSATLKSYSALMCLSAIFSAYPSPFFGLSATFFFRLVCHFSAYPQPVSTLSALNFALAHCD